MLAVAVVVTSFSGPRQQGDSAFETDLRQCAPYTQASRRGLEFVHQAVKTLNIFQIQGDLVDSGLWQGGTSMLMALAEKRYAYGEPQRELWLYDAFETPSPLAAENDAAAPVLDDDELVQHENVGSANATVLAARRRVEDDERTGATEEERWNPGTLLEVRANVMSTGYPPDKLHFVRESPAALETSLQTPDSLPDRIAFLRLDTGSYLSTKAGLDVLWPRMAKGGIMVADDYGFGEGATRAIHEWAQSKERQDLHPVVLNVARKPAANRSVSAVWYVRNLSFR